jgi:hypothetical protein
MHRIFPFRSYRQSNARPAQLNGVRTDYAVKGYHAVQACRHRGSSAVSRLGQDEPPLRLRVAKCLEAIPAGVEGCRGYDIRRPMSTNSAPSAEIDPSHDNCVINRAALVRGSLSANMPPLPFPAPLACGIGGSQLR